MSGPPVPVPPPKRASHLRIGKPAGRRRSIRHGTPFTCVRWVHHRAGGDARHLGNGTFTKPRITLLCIGKLALYRAMPFPP
jgi:hypothetical protein